MLSQLSYASICLCGLSLIFHRSDWVQFVVLAVVLSTYKIIPHPIPFVNPFFQKNQNFFCSFFRICSSPVFCRPDGFPKKQMSPPVTHLFSVYSSTSRYTRTQSTSTLSGSSSGLMSPAQVPNSAVTFTYAGTSQISTSEVRQVSFPSI